MGMAGGAGGGMGFDAAGAYKLERHMLQLTKHSWLAEKAEKELLGGDFPGMGIDLLDLTK